LSTAIEVAEISTVRRLRRVLGSVNSNRPLTLLTLREDHTLAPFNRIEVKGSQGRDVAFILSDNELRQAKIHQDKYEVHFWGRIDLRRPAEDEFRILVDLGYPLRWPHFAKLIDEGHFQLTASEWRVKLKNLLVEDSDDGG
jgi:hypothetical protein